MAEIKKFNGAYMALDVMFHTADDNGKSSNMVRPYKNVGGTSYSTVQKDYQYRILHWKDLKLKATADMKADYDVNDYTCVPVGNTTTTWNCIRGNSTTYTVKITNEADTDITVGCIKFLKDVYANSVYGTVEVLMFGYYFDTPLIIPAHSDKTVVIDLTNT